MRSMPDNFWNWFSKFNAEDITGLVAVVAVFSVAAVGIICVAVYKIHKTRTENALKRELLDRGLSADEIATIICAKSDAGVARRSGSQ
jgi:hypothetical protein